MKLIIVYLIQFAQIDLPKKQAKKVVSIFEVVQIQLQELQEDKDKQKLSHNSFTNLNRFSGRL